jgi:hypothetical protein
MKDVGLYYPHTQIRDSRVVKAAMLIWDEIEIIVPYKDFKLTSVSSEVDKVIKETDFLQVRPPEEEQQAAAQKKIITLFSGDLPDWFLFRPGQPEEQEYLVYPEKLDLETWIQLKKAGVASEITSGDTSHMVLNRSVGLTLMTILAETYAGTTRELLTDVPDAQRAKAHVMAEAAGGTPLTKLSVNERQLVDISLSGVGTDNISLTSLIAAHNDSRRQLRKARALYRRAVGTALQSITPQSTKDDIEWIANDFNQKMRDYREELGNALRVQAAQLLIGPILGGLFSLVGLLPATIATLTGTIGAWLKFRTEREKTLSESPATWLYYLERKRWLV